VRITRDLATIDDDTLSPSHPSVRRLILTCHDRNPSVGAIVGGRPRYEARQRAGIALYPTPLGAREIDALVNLGWLREGAEADRVRVGEAVAAIWLRASELKS
jgi:hypothetical protein